MQNTPEPVKAKETNRIVKIVANYHFKATKETLRIELDKIDTCRREFTKQPEKHTHTFLSKHVLNAFKY